jgi:hypothetical protein
MAQRVWSSLGASQQKRYLAHGITREAYEAGVPLTAARGHASTPERPSKASEQDERYRRYFAARNQAIATIDDYKRDKWGDRDKFDAAKSHKHTIQTLKGKLRSLASLNKIARMVEDDEWDDIESDDDDKSALYYN